MNDRKAIISSCSGLMHQHIDYLSKINMTETGKDLSESEMEVSKAHNFLNHVLANWEYIYESGIGFTKRNPRGTVLSIVSSRYPIYSSTVKLASALISGNSSIIMPPIKSTICALHIAELFNKACGINGAVNAITGINESLYDFIITNDNIDFIDFTGNDKTGRHIASITANLPMSIDIELTDKICDIFTPEEFNELMENILYMTVNSMM